MSKLLEETLQIKYENGAAVLKFEGEVIFENSNQLKEETKNQLKKNKKANNFILDLSQVPYLDSSGVGVILSLLKFIRKNKGSLAVVNPNEKIKRVFEITKLTEIIPVYETIAQAINDMG